jgi:hypothetical protein
MTIVIRQGFCRRGKLLGLMLLALSLMACFQAAAAIAADTPTTADDPVARQLVEQLGAPSFRVRERASRDLAKLGMSARDAMFAGLQSDDAEVRARCQQILSVVLEADYQARLLAFANDRDGLLQLDLPGWGAYREMVGDDRQARLLFVDMHRAEPGLMEAIEGGPRVLSEALAARGQQIHAAVFDQSGARKQPSVGSLAAILFAAADPRVTLSNELVNYMGSYSYQESFQQAITSGPRVLMLRKLLGAWVGRSMGTAGEFTSLVLALRYDLPEGLNPAMNVLSGTGAQSQVTMYALLIVGKFGQGTFGQEGHLDALERLLGDTTTCLSYQVNNEQFRTEVRDVALAVMVHLTGQDMKDYGFTRLQRNNQMLFNPGTLGFRDSDDRYAGIDKWKDWSAKQRRKQARQGGKRADTPGTDTQETP